MKKTYSFSGFLYHPQTQQFLLQNLDESLDKQTWSLITGESSDTKSAQESFLDLAKKILKVRLVKKYTHPVYDYHNPQGKKHFVSYIEVDQLEIIKNSGKNIFRWFSQKEIIKLKLPPQIKQDLIVGQRVINSAIRRDCGEQTIG